MIETVETLLERVAQAETGGDASFYERLCHPEFRTIGPLGFILDRQQWLGRLTSGRYRCTRYDLSEVVDVAVGDIVLALARADIEATFEGQPPPVSSTRVQHVFRRNSGAWQLLSVQHSALPQSSRGAG